MTEPAEKGELIYENVDTAPIVYFDIAPAHGVIGGAVQIELAVRILNAVSDEASKPSSSRADGFDVVPLLP